MSDLNSMFDKIHARNMAVGSKFAFLIGYVQSKMRYSTTIPIEDKIDILETLQKVLVDLNDDLYKGWANEIQIIINEIKANEILSKV